MFEMALFRSLEIPVLGIVSDFVIRISNSGNTPQMPYRRLHGISVLTCNSTVRALAHPSVAGIY
jgi:hypothetical protein